LDFEFEEEPGGVDMCKAMEKRYQEKEIMGSIMGKSRLANGAYFSYNNSYSLEGVAICQSKRISHEGKRHGMRSRH
jgi:hypothetical protein